MKTLLITIVTLVVGLVAFPNQAEARHRHHGTSSYTYTSGHASCGCARYTRRIFNGYDCHGHASYRYIRVPLRHTCRRYNSSRHTSHYSSRSRHNRSRYSNRRSCGTRGSYISFSF